MPHACLRLSARVFTYSVSLGLVFGVFAKPAAAQLPDWAWMSGSNIAGQSGNYGTQFQFNTTNVPGARVTPATWTDATGRLWMFGGEGLDSAGNPGDMNDLWVFDTTQGTHGEWAWMGGASTLPACGGFICGTPGVYGTEYQFDAANIPPGREQASTWVDHSGRLWLYGGELFSYSNSLNSTTIAELNDLWVFDPAQGANGEWAWMGGSQGGPCATYSCEPAASYGTEYQFNATNVPGNHFGAASWIDSSDRLWLFGGVGMDPAGNDNYINELWVFDPTQGTNGEWAWMGGSPTADAAGVYGTPMVFDSNNIPGSRIASLTWTDQSGKFWLFGGGGWDLNDNFDLLNDLWVFDPTQGAHGEWAWMSGSQLGESDGGSVASFDSEYLYDPANLPGGRFYGSSWTDTSGRLWLMGGSGYDAIGDYDVPLNDVWVYDPAQGAWDWVGGSPITFEPGNYGGKYSFSTANFPGARTGGGSWTDQSGNFWLLGGYGLDSQDNLDYLNDLWKMKQTAATKVPAPVFEPGSGTHNDIGEVFILDAAAEATIWYTTDGSTPVPNQGTAAPFDPFSPVLITQNTTLKAVATLSGLTTSSVATANYVLKVPEPFVDLPPGSYTTAVQVNLFDINPNAAIWYTTNGSIPVPGVAPAMLYVSGTPIQITQSTTLKAVAAITGWTNSVAASAKYTLKATKPMLSMASGSFMTTQQVSISDVTPGAAIWYTTDGSIPVPGMAPAVLYGGTPVAINQTTTLKAVAAVTGWTTSPAASGTYTLKTPEPTLGPPNPGSYHGPQSVTISDSNLSAVIWYTTDGSLPVPGVAPAVQYTGSPVTISSTTTLKAVAAISGWTTSAARSGSYTIH